MKKLLLFLLPVLTAIPAAAESRNPLDGPGPGFKADVDVFAGTYPRLTCPFYGVSAYFGYALRNAPLEFSFGLGGINCRGTVSASLSVRALGKWPLGRVSPIVGLSGGWSFQMPSTHQVSISSDPDFGWNRKYIHSSVNTSFGDDGPFADISAGAAIAAGVHEIRLTVSYGLSVCYEGVWGKDENGKAQRYGIIDKYENYPGIGSRYVWTEGRQPMKPNSFLRLQISFSF